MNAACRKPPISAVFKPFDLKNHFFRQNQLFSTGRFYAPSQAFMLCKADTDCREALLKKRFCRAGFNPPYV
jgi:hypothetical protein